MDAAEQVRRLADAAEKLANDVNNLCRDVSTLTSRLEGAPGPYSRWQWEIDASKGRDIPGHPRERGTSWDFKDAMIEIRAGRRLIEIVERHVSAMRNHLNAIEKNPVSREEMKPWLKT